MTLQLLSQLTKKLSVLNPQQKMMHNLWLPVQWATSLRTVKLNQDWYTQNVMVHLLSVTMVECVSLSTAREVLVLWQEQSAHSLSRSPTLVMDQTFQNTKTSTPEDLILALNALLDTNRSFVMREVLGWED